MTAKVLKVGIAGYGVVGKRRGDCVERHPNLKLVAVCDRVFTSDGVLPNGVAHFRTYQQLLQQDLDVLIVCMTNDIADNFYTSVKNRHARPRILSNIVTETSNLLLLATTVQGSL